MTHYRVVIPDITGEHRNVNIGEFVIKANHLEDLGRLGVASLKTLVGGTQAGTTTPGHHRCLRRDSGPAGSGLRSAPP
jgi:hypothetical protein